MKKSLYFKIASLSAIVGFCLNLSGCSAVLFSVGAISDAQKKDYKIVSGHDIGSVDSGRTVCLFEGNSASTSMKYMGIGTLAPSAYEKLYENTRTQKSLGVVFPQIGNSIKILNGVKLSVPVRFDGFTYQYHKNINNPDISNGINSYFVSVTSLSKIETQQVLFDRIGSIIAQDGDSLNGNLARQLILNGQIPVNTIARFDMGSTLKEIQFNQIDSLRIKNSNNAKWKLGAVGLVIDIIATTIFVIKWNNALETGGFL